MDSRYARPPSPGSRRIAHSGRSSTGTLVYPSSYDPYYGPTRSSGNVAAVPRVAERVAPRLVPKYRAESPTRKSSRDDYAVRPRRLTLDTQDAVNTRRPLSMIAPMSPSRNIPIITSSIDRPASPLAKPSRVRPDEGYYLQPASTSSRRDHRRGYTVGSTRESDRLTAGDRDAGGYRSSGIRGGRSGYYLDQPIIRETKGKDEYGYDYNDRREQMYGDLAPKPRPRRDSYSSTGRERPSSIAGTEDLVKRVPMSSRDAGPPVSMRGFDNIGRANSVRQDRRSREEYVPREYTREDYERNREETSRAEVALHQPPSDRYEPRPPDNKYEIRQPRIPKSVIEPRTMHEPKPVVEKLERLEPKRDVYDDRSDMGSDGHTRRYHVHGYKDPDPIDDRDRRRDEDPDRRRNHRHQNLEALGREEARSRAHTHERDHKKEDRSREAEAIYHQERRKEGQHRDIDPMDDRARRREERHREKKDHKEDNHKGETTMLGAAGVAATGLAAAEGIRQHRPHKDDRERLVVPTEPSEGTSVSASADGSDEERRERRRRRREREERRDREEREARELREADEPRRREPEDLGPRETISARDREPSAHGLASPPRENEGSLRESASYERPPHERKISSGSVSREKPSHEDQIRPERDSSRPRRRHHYPHTQDKDSYSESSGDESDFDDRPRQVRVVTPTDEPVEPKEPPKSILRQPREKFPEDPAPVREGVAPLKDAGKKGIPPNARWTKIDRKLVNPDALNAGNERYEARQDYVIVLRVLTKEEIEQYALKTEQIRGERAEGRDGEESSRDS